MREHLVKRREELGYTRQELAGLAGVDLRSVRRWENGIVTPSADKARQLAEALQTTPEFILTGVEANEEDPGVKTNEVERLRSLSGMNRIEFADYFDIPYRTVEDWEKDRRPWPDYLVKLIEYKLINEGLIPQD